jgi:hypothetical protein
MWSGSEEGSYSTLIDGCSLNSRLESNQEEQETGIQPWLRPILGESHDRLGVGGLNGRGAATAEDAQGIPTQSHISSSILVCEDNDVAFSLDSGRDRESLLTTYWSESTLSL